VIAERFNEAIENAIATLLKEGEVVDAGRWQGYATEGRPDLVTREILDLRIDVPLDRGYPMNQLSGALCDQLAHEIRPNRAWADEHFEERVGGKPLNPDPSHVRWPWWKGQDSVTKDEGGKFTHTYSERFWPKGASGASYSMKGIRYEYGDLDDVLTLLYDEPMTRQATFPIFFPEDTGAVHGGRIPCTLHYHFLRRNDQLHMWYPIRSCDAVRHFRDDLYMAARLQLWVLEQLRRRDNQWRDEGFTQWQSIKPGMLHFTAYSFHVHYGDMHHVRF
jgi:hypothetical protein